MKTDKLESKANKLDNSLTMEEFRQMVETAALQSVRHHKGKTKQTKKPISVTWEDKSKADKQLLLLKAVEVVAHGKQLSPQMQAMLPQKLVELLQEQQKHRQLYKTRTVPQRLDNLVQRLQAMGVMDKPSKPQNSLDLLTPQQKARQMAVESLELRRQNAVQMVNAQRLLPKRASSS